MKLYLAVLFLVGLAVLTMAGCLSPVLKIEKRCQTGRLGSTKCECRDMETGQFIVCPPEWKER